MILLPTTLAPIYLQEGGDWGKRRGEGREKSNVEGGRKEEGREEKRREGRGGKEGKERGKEGREGGREEGNES